MEQFHYRIKKLLPPGLFSIALDETRDRAMIEQLAVTMRYVDDNLFIHEYFFGHWQCRSTASKALFNLLKSILETFKLDINKIVAQNYDGASNMSGEKSGLSALVLEINKMALYVHCYAHKFSLALKDASLELVYLASTIDLVNNVASFIEGSTNRHALFKELQDGERVKLVLSQLSQTRWGSRTRSFTSFRRSYKYILEFFNVLRFFILIFDLFK